MKRVLIAAAFLGLSIHGFAHHSFQAEYDQSKPLKLVGKLTRVRVENPHGWIYLDAKNEQGKVVNWALEMPSVNVVQRNGFDAAFIKRCWTAEKKSPSPHTPQETARSTPGPAVSLAPTAGRSSP